MIYSKVRSVSSSKTRTATSRSSSFALTAKRHSFRVVDPAVTQDLASSADEAFRVSMFRRFKSTVSLSSISDMYGFDAVSNVRHRSAPAAGPEDRQNFSPDRKVRVHVHIEPQNPEGVTESAWFWGATIPRRSLHEWRLGLHPEGIQAISRW
jgi:hypothetical protein